MGRARRVLGSRAKVETGKVLILDGDQEGGRGASKWTHLFFLPPAAAADDFLGGMLVVRSVDVW